MPFCSVVCDGKDKTHLVFKVLKPDLEQLIPFFWKKSYMLFDYARSRAMKNSCPRAKKNQKIVSKCMSDLRLRDDLKRN